MHSTAPWPAADAGQSSSMALHQYLQPQDGSGGGGGGDGGGGGGAGGRGATSSMSTSASASLCGFGVGLPMSRLYAQYFGGDLDIKSLEGHGTDCFLHLHRLGERCEHLPDSVRNSPGEQTSELPEKWR